MIVDSTFLGQPPADGLDLPVLLQDFARNVERHVLRVDHTLDKTQVLGHELVAVAHDEHPLDVELDTDVGVPVEQIERGMRRDEQQGLVLKVPSAFIAMISSGSSQACATCL